MVIFVAVGIVVLFGLAHEMARLRNIEIELKENSEILEELRLERVENQQTLDGFQQGVRKELKDTRDKLEKVRDKMTTTEYQ